MGRKSQPTDNKFAPRSVEEGIAALAEAQHGVVSIRQLSELGIGRAGVAARCRRGSLHRVHKGVFAVGHPLLSRHGRWMAAVLACGEGALLSHRDAAALLGLCPLGGGAIDVTVTGRSRRERPGIRIHRPRRLLDRDRTEADGIPCTSVARTLLDLAERGRRREIERACDEAELLQLFDLYAILELLDRADGHRGARRLRRVLATHKAGSTPTRSELEEAFLWIPRRARLRMPRVNAWIPFPEGGGTEVDFFWPEQRLIVEVDGLGVHSRRRTMIKDYGKNLRLDQLGYIVKRFLWGQVIGEPDAIADVLARHLPPPN